MAYGEQYPFPQIQDGNFNLLVNQYFDQEKMKFVAMANGPTDNIDFGKFIQLQDGNYNLLRAQYFDVEKMKFVAGFPPDFGGGGGGGEPGPEGPIGPVGPPGPIGETGLPGKDGAIGPKGDTGEKGDRGERGEKGDTGERGLQGEKGAKGDTGDKGERGEVGPAGETGPEGPRGIEGPIGPRGNGFNIEKRYPSVVDAEADVANRNIGDFVLIDADPSDPDNGLLFEVMEGGLERISQLAGARGDDGARGPEGPRGEAGPVGPAGIRGLQGEAGPKGDQGIQGESVKVLGTRTEATLPTTGNVEGDAYWVGTTLRTWNGTAFVSSGNLQGPQGTQGLAGPKGDPGRGVDDIGTAALLTQAQTIKESINEVFTSGNNVKRNTVNALLSKSPTLPITQSSTWSQINSAIDQLQLGYKVNGVNYSTGMAFENILEGDYVKFIEGSTGVVNASLTEFTFGLSSGIDYVPVGDNRLLVIQSKGINATDTTQAQSTEVVVIERNRTNINVLQAATVSTRAGSGRMVKIIKMSDNTYVIGYAGANYNLILQKVTLGLNDAIQLGTGIVVDSTTYAGDDFALCRVADNKILVASENGNAQGRARLVTFTKGATTEFTAHTHVVVPTSGRNIQLFSLVNSEEATRTRFIMMGGAPTGSSSTTANSYVTQELNVNTTNNTVTLQRSAFYANNNNGAANVARAISVPGANGLNNIYVFTRDVANQNKINMRVFTYTTNVADHPTTIGVTLETGVGSGGTTTSSRPSMYSVKLLGGGIIGILYDNPTLDNLSLGFISTTNPQAGIYATNKIVNANSKRLPTLLVFPSGELGVARINTSTGTTGRWSYFRFTGLAGQSGYAKYNNPAFPTNNTGIALADATAGEVVRARRSV